MTFASRSFSKSPAVLWYSGLLEKSSVDLEPIPIAPSGIVSPYILLSLATSSSVDNNPISSLVSALKKSFALPPPPPAVGVVGVVWAISSLPKPCPIMNFLSFSIAVFTASLVYCSVGETTASTCLALMTGASLLRTSPRVWSCCLNSSP